MSDADRPRSHNRGFLFMFEENDPTVGRRWVIFDQGVDGEPSFTSFGSRGDAAQQLNRRWLRRFYGGGQDWRDKRAASKAAFKEMREDEVKA